MKEEERRQESRRERREKKKRKEEGGETDPQIHQYRIFEQCALSKIETVAIWIN